MSSEAHYRAKCRPLSMLSGKVLSTKLLLGTVSSVKLLSGKVSFVKLLSGKMSFVKLNNLPYMSNACHACLVPHTPILNDSAT